jgi:hypothetical protein
MVKNADLWGIAKARLPLHSEMERVQRADAPHRHHRRVANVKSTEPAKE